MGSPLVDVGTGITVAFATSGFSIQILDVTPYAMSRVSIDTSHQGTTGARTFSPVDLYDAGELSFTGHFNPDTSPPINGANESITVTFPAGATAVFSGHMTAYNPGSPLEDKMTVDVTIKISGSVTITGA